MAEYNDINDSAKIEFPVPPELEQHMKKAEEYDLAGKWWRYSDEIQLIEELAEKAVAEGKISALQKEIIGARYRMK
ncbi:MAG: hypothetical protein LKG56_10915 [Lachnospiraceae bacterium]|jgi:hypothetical protein|nr:hypothetical protein [Lachnospiraceae bacterium]MCH4032234.1 hypothetical protein [Lachnospiraceae bacterium]MCH4108888.1 hypothetical protein [Lachnospiraceae bacterium]MCI1303187.1 hypothetical protein [Lachnospiraceae bacterium]MCI1332769.1 hypothetical protein [Lachnospiraceae bacterium]